MAEFDIEVVEVQDPHRVARAIDQAVRLLSFRKDMAQGAIVPRTTVVRQVQKTDPRLPKNEVEAFIEQNPEVLRSPARIRH